MNEKNEKPFISKEELKDFAKQCAKELFGSGAKGESTESEEEKKARERLRKKAEKVNDRFKKDPHGLSLEDYKLLREARDEGLVKVIEQEGSGLDEIIAEIEKKESELENIRKEAEELLEKIGDLEEGEEPSKTAIEAGDIVSKIEETNDINQAKGLLSQLKVIYDDISGSISEEKVSKKPETTAEKKEKRPIDFSKELEEIMEEKELGARKIYLENLLSRIEQEGAAEDSNIRARILEELEWIEEVLTGIEKIDRKSKKRERLRGKKGKEEKKEKRRIFTEEEKALIEKFSEPEYEKEKIALDPIYKFLREKGINPEKYNFKYVFVDEKIAAGKGRWQESTNYHDHLSERNKLSEEEKRVLDNTVWLDEQQRSVKSPRLSARGFYEQFKNPDSLLYRYKDEFYKLLELVLKEELEDEYAQAVIRKIIKKRAEQKFEKEFDKDLADFKDMEEETSGSDFEVEDIDFFDLEKEIEEETISEAEKRQKEKRATWERGEFTDEEKELIEKFSGPEYEEEKKKYDALYMYWKEKGYDPEEFNFIYKLIYEVKVDKDDSMSGTPTTIFSYHDYLMLRGKMSEEERSQCDGEWKDYREVDGEEIKKEWSSPGLFASKEKLLNRLKNPGDELYKYRDEFYELQDKLLKEELPDEYAIAVLEGKVKERDERGEIIEDEEVKETIDDASKIDPDASEKAAEALGEIKDLDKEGKKTFLEGTANLGFRIAKKRSEIMGRGCQILSTLTKKSNFLSNYFKNYVNEYVKDYNRSQKAIERRGKGKMLRVSGIGRGAGIIFRYGRAIYDAVDQASFGKAYNSLNPFRHATAAAMFLGRSAGVLKETRLEDYESAKEKVRVKDFERAEQEAWDLYEQAKKENNEVGAEDLEKAYKENLPEDVLKRFRRGNIPTTEWYKLYLNKSKSMRSYADSLFNKIYKIEQSDKSEPEKKKAREELLMRNDELINDLDRMVGDDGIVDAIAYYSRMAEKTGKGVATALIIDSVWRIAKTSWNLHYLFDKYGEQKFQGVFSGAKERLAGLKAKLTPEEEIRKYVMPKDVFEEEEEQRKRMEILGPEEITGDKLTTREVKSETKRQETELVYKDIRPKKDIFREDDITGEVSGGSTAREEPRMEKLVPEETTSGKQEIQVQPKPPKAEEIKIEQKDVLPEEKVSTSRAVDQGEKQAAPYVVERRGKTELKASSKSVARPESEVRSRDIPGPRRAAEAVAPEAEVKIEGKVDTISEGVYEAVKKASPEVQDNFIYRELGNSINITDQNRDQYIGEAIRKVSASNIIMGDGDDIKNLVHAGDIIRLNKDGSWELVEKSGYKAKAVSELKLRQNAAREWAKDLGIDPDKVEYAGDVHNLDKRTMKVEVGGQEVIIGKDGRYEVEVDGKKMVGMIDKDKDKGKGLEVIEEHLGRNKGGEAGGEYTHIDLKDMTEGTKVKEDIVEIDLEKMGEEVPVETREEFNRLAGESGLTLEQASQAGIDLKDGISPAEKSQIEFLTKQPDLAKNPDLARNIFKISEVKSESGINIDYQNIAENYQAVKDIANLDQQRYLVELIVNPNEKSLKGLLKGIGVLEDNRIRKITPRIERGNLVLFYDIKGAPDFKTTIYTNGRAFVDGPALWNKSFKSLKNIKEILKWPLEAMGEMESKENVVDA